VVLAACAGLAPVATASYSKMTPNDVMAKIGQTISFVARQKPAFAMIRPKRVRMTGRTYYFWGGKDTCRPGHDNNPLLYSLGDTGTKFIGGDCKVNGPAPPGSLAHHPNSPGTYTKNMNKVAATLEARDGLSLPHGNTTSIRATNTKAKLTFKNGGEPGDIKSLSINSKGRVVDTTRYKQASSSLRRQLSRSVVSWNLPRAPQVSLRIQRENVIQTVALSVRRGGPMNVRTMGRSLDNARRHARVCVAIGAEEENTCTLRSTGQAACWGNNSFGQVGDGTDTNRFTPINVSGLGDGGGPGGREPGGDQPTTGSGGQPTTGSASAAPAGVTGGGAPTAHNQNVASCVSKANAAYHKVEKATAKHKGGKARAKATRAERKLKAKRVSRCRQ
jgi:hypothetical protein